MTEAFINIFVDLDKQNCRIILTEDLKSRLSADGYDEQFIKVRKKGIN